MSENCTLFNHNLDTVFNVVLPVKHLIEFRQVSAAHDPPFLKVHLLWQTKHHRVVIHPNHFAEQRSLKVLNHRPLTHFLKPIVQINRVVAGCLCCTLFCKLVHTVIKDFSQFLKRHSCTNVFNYEQGIRLSKKQFLAIG